MIGRLISGRYRLIAPLGEGGMATIWRALDEQLDREVAVKILRPQFSADAGFAARFKLEARSAAGLSHPNIVGVYDYGTDGADGEQYIVMELVDGRDLAAILKERGSLSRDDAVRVAIGVASALEVAHRKGIVHRDVKPGNIMITDAGDVKVADFGIARAVSEASMTVTGTTLGSVHYFSPEQARGDEVTGASDVYALGIVLYEALTGRRPFEGDSAAAVALKRLNEDPPTPTALGHPLPPGLEAIVMRALARDPADRYPDAGAFAEALRVWRRDPDALPAAGVVGVAGAAAMASTPAGGEPTVYVPPRVTTPADNAPVAPPPSRGDGYPPDDDRGQPWWMWVLVTLGILFLALIGFFGFQLLSGDGTESPSPSVAQVTVPDCDDVPLTTLRSEALELGLTVREDDEFSEDVEEDRVIRCEPATGEQVDDGTTITAFVSSGIEQVAVPRLRGQSEADARASLETAGLSIGAIAREPDPDVPSGSVLRSDPVRGDGRGRRLAGRPRRQHRADAVADPDPHAGADPDPHAHAYPDPGPDPASGHAVAVAVGTGAAWHPRCNAAAQDGEGPVLAWPQPVRRVEASSSAWQPSLRSRSTNRPLSRRSSMPRSPYWWTSGPHGAAPAASSHQWSRASARSMPRGSASPRSTPMRISSWRCATASSAFPRSSSSTTAVRPPAWWATCPRR